MGKITFVFAGQGAQYSGMGKELATVDPSAAQVFARIDAIRPGTSDQCFSGAMEELSRTKNTQPCMFAVEMAAAEALAAAGICPDYLAGFSVGEIAALTFSGAVSFEDGFKLVCSRGQLMQECSEQADTAMTAVLKLDENTVEQLCSHYDHIYPVNYNCPGQIVVAGLRTSMEDFKLAVKQAGGRAMPLPVSGAFHTPFMAEAARKLGDTLAAISFSAPGIPLYANYSGSLYQGDFRQLLTSQICNPVRWQQIVEQMAQEGVDTFIEVGPGSTLSGFINRTLPEARTLHVENAASLEETICEVKDHD